MFDKGNHKIKRQALRLRKQGKTYSEILKVIPVAKSTLSLWLREVGLSISQQQHITEKRMLGQKRGAAARRSQRQKLQASIHAESAAEIGSISKRELWLLGIALYWAEGSKEKEYAPGSRAVFSNSNPAMISLYIKWLRECVRIPDTSILCAIYIHESHMHRREEVLRFWRKSTGLHYSRLQKIYIKKNKINTKRKNTGILYNGVLRVTITSSSTLNRRITGWIQGIVKNCGIV